MIEDRESYLSATREWLNNRFDVFDDDGIYVPNQPSYGFSALSFRLEEYARTFAILRLLSRLDFQSVLDLGCADGYFTELVHRLFSVKVTGADLSDRALVRAGQMYNLKGCAVDAHVLPFKDNSFDLVIGSEMLEHVVDPGYVVSEMKRIASKYVVITTPRAVGDDAVQQHFDSLDPGEPHAHIHYFTDRTIRDLCGKSGFYYTARSTVISKILNRSAWADQTDLVQRKAYLEFTIESTNLECHSQNASKEALIGRYRKCPAWKKKFIGSKYIGLLLRLDVMIAAKFPSLTYDHLVVIPKESNSIPCKMKKTNHRLLQMLLSDYHVSQLRKEAA